MLPIIGFIVATYTGFRFIETLGRPGDTVVKVIAFVALLFTAFLCYALWNSSASMPSYPH
jgi:hypothetical protein